MQQGGAEAPVSQLLGTVLQLLDVATCPKGVFDFSFSSSASLIT